MSKRFNDLSKKKIGFLYVVGLDVNSKYRRWICKCDCGSTVSLRADQVMVGHCGCRNKQAPPAISRERLYSLFVTQGLNIKEMSKITGLHRNTLSKYVSTYGLRQEKLNGSIPIRTRLIKKPGPKPRKLIGRTFGALTVTEYIDSKNVWCYCLCKTKVSISVEDLYSGKSTSCGCGHSLPEVLPEDRLLFIWSGLISQYAPYVCEEWNNYSSFREWAYANGYKKGAALEKVDRKQMYEPKNCKWIVHRPKQRNRSNIIWIEIGEERKSLSQWSKEFGLNYSKTYQKYRNGYRGKELFIETF